MIKNLRTILTIKNNFYKKQEKEGKQLSIKEKNKEQQMMMTILMITLMKTKYFQIMEVIINIKMLMIWKMLIILLQLEKEGKKDYNFIMLKNSNLLLDLVNSKCY